MTGQILASSALSGVYFFCSSDRSSSGMIAFTGHSGMQTAQSMHSSGSITSMFGPSWKQSTGQTSTQSVYLHLMQLSVTTWVIAQSFALPARPEGGAKGKIIRLSSRCLKARADGYWSFAYIRIEVAIESGSAGRGGNFSRPVPVCVGGLEGGGIKAGNLSKSFGSERAVDGVSFEVGTGEVLWCLGSNGAGKVATRPRSFGFI